MYINNNKVLVKKKDKKKKFKNRNKIYLTLNLISLFHVYAENYHEKSLKLITLIMEIEIKKL